MTKLVIDILARQGKYWAVMDGKEYEMNISSVDVPPVSVLKAILVKHPNAEVDFDATMIENPYVRQTYSLYARYRLGGIARLIQILTEHNRVRKMEVKQCGVCRRATGHFNPANSRYECYNCQAILFPDGWSRIKLRRGLK